MASRKTERNKRLYEYYLREHDKHDSTYQDVANVFHMSVSRTWTIINKYKHKLDKEGVGRMTRIICPQCKGINIVSCPGGTNKGLFGKLYRNSIA